MSVYIGGDQPSRRKQRKDAGKKMNFLVFIRSKSSHRKTKGRFYRYVDKAHDRANHLADRLTRNHEVVVYMPQKKWEMRTISGRYARDTFDYIRIFPFGLDSLKKG